MPKVPITVMGYKCARCGHEWIPRDSEQEPRACPKCKSLHWNTPINRGAATTYDEFRSRVESALRSESDGLTWSQIRTNQRLPQKLPNNGWVRRLETDIGLVRERLHGVIIWRLGN